MPQDFRALFAPDKGPDFNSLFAPDEISEAEANRTFTPDEQARIALANPGGFGAGTAKRMAEYEGLSPEAASSKYRQGWADTFSNIYDTVSDPTKLGSAVVGAVGAGANAVAHPIDTVNRIGNYYYENPDAAVTDTLFAAAPIKYAPQALGAVTRRAPTNAMPRASVREGPELLKTGGERMEAAKLNPSKVDADAIAVPLAEFREATKTVGLETPLVKAIAKKLENAYTPRKPGAMSRLTGVQPEPRPGVKLNDLHGYEQALTKFINGAGKTEGRINSQGYEAIELKKAVDKIILNHPESSTFKIGKHEYHRGKMSQAMDDILERARGRVQWKNGDEAAALQAEVSNFLRVKKNRYALTPDARRKLGKFASDRKGHRIGSFGLSNNSFGGNVFARGIETAVFGFPGALAPIGQATRTSRNARILKEFQDIQAELRAGGPVR